MCPLEPALLIVTTTPLNLHTSLTSYPGVSGKAGEAVTGFSNWKSTRQATACMEIGAAFQMRLSKRVMPPLTESQAKMLAACGKAL